MSNNISKSLGYIPGTEPDETILPNFYKTKFQGIVYDQKFTGLCVPCSLCLIKRIQVYLATDTILTFNPNYIYAYRNNSLYTGEGMNIVDGLKILKTKGVSTINPKELDYYNYDKAVEELNAHKEEWDTEAENYKIKGYFKVTKQNEIKKAIMKYGAVTSRIPEYDCLKNPTEPDGTSYIKYDGTTPKTDKYHQVTLIGWYNDYWIMQNSWGNEYGANGVVYLPMNYPIKESYYCI